MRFTSTHPTILKLTPMEGPSSRRVRHVGIRNERQCSIKNLDACPWSYRFRREMPAKGARARYTAKQPKDMARDGRQAHALVKLASHIGDESRNGGLRRRQTRGLAEQPQGYREKLP